MSKRDIGTDKTKLALLAKMAMKRFLKTKGKEESLSLVLNTSNVTHFEENSLHKISLASLENRQHFYTSIIAHSPGKKTVIDTLIDNREYENLGITEFFDKKNIFEKSINIEPFKDLRKKVKRNTATKNEKEILSLCEKYKIVFGIRKDVYETNESGDIVYHSGERKIKSKGGAIVVAISSPTMAVSKFDYDEVVKISPDVVKKYWGVQTLAFLNSKEDGKDARKLVSNLLNYMENADISDLHMGQSDDESYFITARQHTKIINVNDENNEPIRYATSKANNISNMLRQMANIDTESKDLATNGVLCADLATGRRTFRLNVFKTVNNNERGFSFSLRKLSKEEELKTLQELNYLEIVITAIEYLLQKEDGMTIISGKTNSGKTTLLVAMLKILRDRYNKRIARMGNPIEIPLDNTIMVDTSHYGSNEELEIDDNNKIVQYVLKQFLRHDPDVTVSEEVRSSAERKIALELAERGHLTLVTSHAKTHELAVKSFLDVPGVKMSDVGSVLNGGINQKLILKPCKHCEDWSDVAALDCEVCGGSRASGVLPVCDIVVYTNVGIDDNILDTDTLVQENKAFRIDKDYIISCYKELGVIDKDSEVTFVGDTDSGKMLIEKFAKEVNQKVLKKKESVFLKNSFSNNIQENHDNLKTSGSGVA